MARIFVPDASIAVKWFVPETSWENARLVLATAQNGNCALHVPSLWDAEVANALWQKTRRRSADRVRVDEAAVMVDRLVELGIRRHEDRWLLPVAFALAAETAITIYDALYVTLAIREDGQVITDDERLINGLKPTEFSGSVVRLRDVTADTFT
jgi:predicted nucleic acid-binding protein